MEPVYAGARPQRFTVALDAGIPDQLLLAGPHGEFE